MTAFETIRERAARRKGGEKILATLLSTPPEPDALARIPDDRILAEMTRRIFCSGFNWTVIDKKWPGFEEAFLGFSPERLLFEPDDFWSDRVSDTRVVRNGQKIMSIRANAEFIADVAREHGGFGKFLADWPVQDQIGLLEVLAKRGSRLGGNTGQYFLRFIGKDGFVLSRDVLLCLRDSGLDIAESPTSKRDLGLIQAQFNRWADETGLPYAHLSRICSLSIGENYSVERLQEYMGE